MPETLKLKSLESSFEYSFQKRVAQLSGLESSLRHKLFSGDRALSTSNRSQGYEVVTSDDNPHFAAYSISDILAKCYGKNGFPIKAFLDPGVVLDQIQEKKLHSWLLVKNGKAFVTSNFRLSSPQEWELARKNNHPIHLELARSASYPINSEYPGDAKGTELMQLRQWELVSGNQPSWLQSHPFAIGDARAAVKRTLPTGATLPEGSITLHSIKTNGLMPVAVHASYQFPLDTYDTYQYIQEPMILHIMPLDKTDFQKYLDQHPFFLPQDSILEEFIFESFKEAGFSCDIQTVKWFYYQDIRVSFDFNGVYFECELSRDGLKGQEINDFFKHQTQANSALLKIDAIPDNFPAIYTLIDKFRFVPVGILPGTSTFIFHPVTKKPFFYTQHHKLILSRLKNNVLNSTLPLSLPRDWSDKMRALATSLWQNYVTIFSQSPI